MLSQLNLQYIEYMYTAYSSTLLNSNLNPLRMFGNFGNFCILFLTTNNAVLGYPLIEYLVSV